MKKMMDVHPFILPRALSIFAGLVLALGLPTGAMAQGGGSEEGGADAQKGSARLTKPPKLVQTVEADYTQAAIDARAEGPVRLKLTISATGEVTKVEILEGPGYGLNEAAAKAAEQFIFEPAEINNVPSPVILDFVINFELSILPSAFTGKVIDAGSGNGLVDASVTIVYKGEGDFEEPPSATALTEADGSFSFTDVPPGNYKVILKLDAYRDYETDIELVPGETSEATYKVDAQPVNYIGQIREAGTRKLLPGITVEITEITDGKPEAERLFRQEFTDAQGKFGFRGLPPGKYRVLLDAQGYKSAAFVEEIKANERLDGKYYIEAEFYDEYTVVTTARRERRSVDRQTLTLQESRRIPGTGGDVVRVVQNLPGVARSPFGAGLLVVRGSNPQDSAVFLEGDELPIVYHFLAGPAVVNSEMIQSIDFYPGNFSSRYGRAIGGVINLDTRSPRNDQVHGFAEIDVQDASALVEVPLGKNWSFALAGRRSYVDKVLQFVIPRALPEGALPATIAPYYYDYQSWLTFRGFEGHLLELFVYGSQDRLEVILDEPQGDTDIQITTINQETRFHRGQFRWEWRPDDTIENTFMVSGGLIQTGFDVGDAFGFATDLWTINVRDDLELKPSDKLSVRMGTDTQFTYSIYELNIPGFDDGGTDNPFSTGLDGNGGLSVNYPAYWMEAAIRPIDRLELTPGLRIDYYSNITRATFSPRFSTRFNVNKKVAFKGGIGLFDQPPNPGNTFENFGNPDLLSEKAIHYALGGEWRPLEFLEFNTTLFYRDMYDLVSSTDEFIVDPETGQQEYTFFNNEGEGRAYGAELLLRHYPNKRLFGWIAYTLSRSERLDLETGEWELFGFDQTHILTMVAGYNLPYNFDISARFRLVSGNPYTPIVGSVFNADNDSYSPVNGEPNSARNQAFNQLDIRVDKNFVFNRWLLGVYLDIQNIYNASNAEGVLYNYDYTDSQPLNGLPIFPNLGVTAKF